MPLSLDEGTKAVRLARETLDNHVRGVNLRRRDEMSGPFAEKRGVFVTINKVESGVKMLRGCLGYPTPYKPLGEAIVDRTIAASRDERFPFPVAPEELDDILVEVSILTIPTELVAQKREDLPSKIRLGVDGVIVSNRYAGALFLPQVATEQGWDAETYLCKACEKAGLPYDEWVKPSTTIEVFQAQVFTEEEPRGAVVSATHQ